MIETVLLWGMGVFAAVGIGCFVLDFFTKRRD